MSSIKCLETRVTPDGIKRRRYEHPDGTRMSTVEVPLKLWVLLCADSRSAAKKETWFKRQTVASKKCQARQLSASGKAQKDIAAQLGVSISSVSRWTRAKKVLERAAA